MSAKVSNWKGSRVGSKQPSNLSASSTKKGTSGCIVWKDSASTRANET